MLLKSGTINGMTTMGTYAPLVNFVAATITDTSSVAIAPVASSTVPGRQWGSRRPSGDEPFPTATA